MDFKQCSNVLGIVSYQLKMHQHLSHSQPLQMHCFEGCQICSWLVPLLPSQLRWFVWQLRRWILRPRYQFHCCKLCDVVLMLQCLGNKYHTFYRCIWSRSSSEMDSSCRTEGRSVCCLEPKDQQCCVSINKENDQWCGIINGRHFRTYAGLSEWNRRGKKLLGKQL